MDQAAIESRTAVGVRPLREVWSIAWPTVLTMTSYTVMQFVDKVMVAQVGPLEVAAQGNGGIWAFTLMSPALGVVTVVNTYVSQHLGAGTPRKGPAYAWAAFWIGAGLWLAAMLPGAALLPLLFASVGHDPLLVAMESGYCRILLAGSVFLLVSRGLNHFFFGLHRPRIVTLSAILGNVTNVLANYVLIYGDRGLPAWGLPGVPGVTPLGVYGAALGTVLGTTVELAIPAAIFLGPRLHRELGTRAAWRPRWRPIAEVVRIGWPAALQWGSETAAWAVFMALIVGDFGPDHMTAGYAALGYLHLSFMPAVGFSVAVTSLVGRYIGAGAPDTAVARAHLGLGLAVGYMTACAVLFYVFRRELISLFVAMGAVDPDRAASIVEIGSRLMICAAVFQTFDAFGIVYTGALRGAGDTVWPGVITIVYAWSMLVGGGWAVAKLAPGLESIGPWIAASVFIIVYGLTMWHRFETGRWRSIRLVDRAVPAAA